MAWFALAVWVVLGALGLYASLHKGTREVVSGLSA
jgi:hypothetical protein